MMLRVLSSSIKWDQRFYLPQRTVYEITVIPYEASVTGPDIGHSINVR